MATVSFEEALKAMREGKVCHCRSEKFKIVNGEFFSEYGKAGWQKILAFTPDAIFSEWSISAEQKYQQINLKKALKLFSTTDKKIFCSLGPINALNPEPTMLDSFSIFTMSDLAIAKFFIKVG